MDFAGRLIAGILAVILCVIFPLQYIVQQYNENIDAHVEDHTKALSDSVREKGFLDKKTYEKYVAFLDTTGDLYDIELEDIHPVTGDEVEKADAGNTTNLLNLSVLNTTHEELSLPGTKASLGIKTKLLAAATHTHTDACYAGHRHTALTDTSFTHYHTHISGSCYEYIAASNNYVTCSNCGRQYLTHAVYWNWNYAYNTTIYAGEYSQTSCPNCGSQSTVYGSGVSKNIYNYTCGYMKDINGDGLSDQVGYGTQYAYIKNYPQVDSFSASYGSFSDSGSTSCTEKRGCYTYHLHGKLPFYGEGTTSSSFVWHSSYANNPMYLLKTYGVSKFCYIPQTYTATLYDSYRGWSQATITYSGALQSDGSVIFIKQSGPAGYPYSLTSSDFFYYFSSTTGYLDFLSRYGSAQSGSPYDYYILSSFSGGIDLCNITTAGTWYCDQTEDTTPICDQVVTSIIPTNPNQTVFKGNSIVTTATATMLDGSTKTVSCTASGYNSNTIGTQTVTLTYSGLVDNAKTTGTKSCSISVNVIPNKSLTSISVSPATQTIGKSGTPTFTVTAYYSDGTSAVLSSSQYSRSSFDTTVGGIKNITFSYSENGITKTAVATVYVDELTSITASPSDLSVERYTTAEELPITLTATYLYGSNKTITSGYAVSGYSPSLLGKQNVTVTYTEYGVSRSVTINVTVTKLQITCPRCGNTYELTEEDVDPGCPFCKAHVIGISVVPDQVEVKQGDKLPITVTATYEDDSTGAITGWTSNYDASKPGLQLITVEFAGFSAEVSVWVKEATIKCPICGTEYPSSLDSCPVCADTLISISTDPQEITVNQYDEINLNVTSHYRDGSSKAVTDWSSDCSTAIPGTFSAVITYQDVSTTIKLTVVAKTAVTCPICGTVYEPEDNPKGCPICSNFIVGIEAYMTSGSNLVQLGSTPSVTVVLIFRDSHRELVDDGYTVEDYNSDLLGPQTVTVFYREFYTSLDIVVVNTLNSVTCPNGHVYYLNDDGTDPGCPYCHISEDVGSVYYYDTTYTADILEAVYTDGKYQFDKGNYIVIHITKKDVSMITRIQKMYPKTSLLGRRKKYIYGGEVS